MNSSSICMAISASSSNTSLNQCLNPFLGKLFPSKPNQNLRRTACVRANTKALLSSSKQAVLNDFHERRALKIISGLQNFDRENVASVVTAADKGGATHVDIACDPDLVRLAIGLTSLPVCVSSVDPAAFSAAVEAGALMVEIGNYDSFYEAGVIFSPEQILKLTKETRSNLPSITLSVTVPHTLSLPDQVKLAEMLEKEGVDVIQTEGGKCSTPSKSGVLGLIEKISCNIRICVTKQITDLGIQIYLLLMFLELDPNLLFVNVFGTGLVVELATPTLAAAYSISRAVKIPVMCSSGLSAVTAPMAITAGAAGVGVGSAVNKLNDVIAMVAEVRSIAESLKMAAADQQITHTDRSFMM
ncbi:DUF561 domain-containing protein [Gossypium australe]|uniref:Uncharacterized protein ycf23 n=1 Tax=Gossypium australe TaxID=47621 RepID=A0A5B6WCE3_9ROSI|nr:DUF561 domain-containing protein [Gossypium australe]